MTYYRNCITPEGRFLYGIHKPSYSVINLREDENIESLGRLTDDSAHFNTVNYPQGDITVEQAGWIFEVPNPLPFRGTTYIDKGWADSASRDSSRFKLPPKPHLSFADFLTVHDIDTTLLGSLPRPLLLTLASCSTDAEDLKALAEKSCDFCRNEHGEISGLRYNQDKHGKIRPAVADHDLFEAVANNPALPDIYKKAMVLRPGAQGNSEITAEWRTDDSHIYEYLRKNSYIAGGHFAANMADDAVRYSIASLSEEDMQGLRHLYYQRMYVCIAEKLGVRPAQRKTYTIEQLETLRLELLAKLSTGNPPNLATLWGWNFGFDYSPTDYRLHASHQQIHQQYALIPQQIQGFHDDPETSAATIPSFCCGDLVTEAIADYRRHRQSELFRDYFKAISRNVRMDKRSDLPSSLVVWEDKNVMVIVPKAQTSQWELQIITKPDDSGFLPGNIIETDIRYRRSLDTALLKAQQALEKLGARMVTSIEFSKRIDAGRQTFQPLIYSLLPKLPYSMGAFSEAQLRFICGHYPEDFAAACRNQLEGEREDNSKR